MKPSTYHVQDHTRSCGKCAFAGWQSNLDQFLCYNGDTTEAVQDSLDLDGDELDEWWVERDIDPEGVCADFRPGRPQNVTWLTPYEAPAETSNPSDGGGKC